jgi:hypothetical protein
LEIKLRCYNKEIFLNYKSYKFPYKVILSANGRISLNMNDDSPELREFLKVV